MAVQAQFAVVALPPPSQLDMALEEGPMIELQTFEDAHNFPQ